MSNKRTKYIMVRIGNLGYPVTISMSGKQPVAMFTDGTPSLDLPENWTREMIRKHIMKHMKVQYNYPK